MAPERGDRSLPAGTEGLPRVFLQSLRTLFDILDDRRRGYVHLREIESRWRGAEARELPAGVMEGLRRAAPASGYLTFERFVLGLRAALPGAEPAVESGGGGRRSVEKPASPRCAEERRGKSSGQREPGPSQPRGRGGEAKAAGQSQGDGSHPGAGDARRHQRGRAEHRRHTITNGVDFSMDFLPEGGQSRLGRLVPKLQEVNRCLGDLLSTAGKPANPSSALSRLGPVVSPASAGSQQAIIMLKEQNRLLTKEVTDKSERITQLEQEKSALIKQLFEARAHNNHETSQLDSTFI
ncbi:suppressor APC domain-containing protein 2 isoform X3 [Haliaeetus albicilla]|uniref:suppressor APC domain-containing protein 2 isoform X3 n=1 Tax=Haliaeetus albicilla TaxID=8969 RepID=UPI0037E9A5CB